MKINHIYQGDALKVLKTFPDESINCVMTSPPYWALRDYGTAKWKGGDSKCDHRMPRSTSRHRPGDKSTTNKGSDPITWKVCGKCGAIREDEQLGLEPTFEEHIKNMCDIFDEVKRVLRKDGTCWVNYGDTFASSPTGSASNPAGTDGVYSRLYKRNIVDDKSPKRKKDFGSVSTKSLTMIPFRFAIEMVNRGWILRNVIIWHKSNPMPSSAKDRFTVDFEYLFFFSKSRKYWFEQQFDKLKASTIERDKYTRRHSKVKDGTLNKSLYRDDGSPMISGKQGRNTRTVWKIPTQPFPEAHFAVYPEKLCITPIKAGCPEFICKKCGKAREKIYEKPKPPESVYTKTKRGEDKLIGASQKGGKAGSGQKYQNWRDKNPDKVVGLTDCKCKAGFRKGIVLDPFMGAGTTAVVARKLGRGYVGIELNPEYIKIADKRLQQQILL